MGVFTHGGLLTVLYVSNWAQHSKCNTAPLFTRSWPNQLQVNAYTKTKSRTPLFITRKTAKAKKHHAPPNLEPNPNPTLVQKKKKQNQVPSLTTKMTYKTTLTRSYTNKFCNEKKNYQKPNGCVNALRHNTNTWACPASTIHTLPINPLSNLHQY